MVQKFLKMARPIPLTSKVSQWQAVTYAVYLMKGAQKPLDTEDIAVQAHKLDPKRFAWRKYPGQINLELVRVALSDAKKPEHGSLLKGSGRSGWRLTRAGLAWAQEADLRNGIKSPVSTRSSSRRGSPELNQLRREIARIKLTNAWAKWSTSTGPLDRADAREVYRIDSYTNPEMTETKIARLLDQAADDQRLTEFLNALADLLRLKD